MKNKPVFVLLAGGKSARMGVAKGLLKFKKTFWILEQLQRISETGITQAYIGLGYDYQHYFDAIEWFEKACNTPIKFLDLEIRIIRNTNPELGSFSTFQKVLFAIPTNSEIVINPIDTPILNKIEFRLLIKEKNKIVIPSFDNKNGHPIKLNPSFWNDLKKLHLNDKNARLDYQIKKTALSKITVLKVLDSAILLNLNTPTEWRNYYKSYD